MGLEAYSTTPANNNSSPPNGAPEGMAPSGVNDCIRQIMADVRSYAEGAQWFNYGHTPTRVDNDTFTVVTDLTATYTVGRRLKLTGGSTGYCTITASSYSAPNTTVDVLMDSGNVPSPLTTVSLGILTSSSSSLPTTYTNALTAPAFIPSSSTIPVDGTYLPAAHTVGIATNTTLRWSVNSTGNHVFAAPSSGVPVTVNSTSATRADFNTTNATGGYVSLSNSGGVAGYIGTGSGTIAGAALADLCLASASGVMRLGYNGGSATAISIGTAGNVTINAPSSGTTAALTSVATGVPLSMTDGTLTSRWTFAGSIVTFGAQSNHAVNIETNGSPRIAVSAAGNVSINAPSSGTALSVTGVSGGTSQSWTDGTRTAAIAHSASLVQIGTTTADSFGIFVNNSNKVTVNTGVQIGSAVGGDKGSGTLNTAGNIYVNGVLIVDTGSFTATLTGCTTSPTFNCVWSRAGNSVTLHVPNTAFGTSNSSSCGFTGLPAAIQAARAQTISLFDFIDNGVIVTDVGIGIGTSGTVTFLRANGVAFTTSGTKGVSTQFSVTYLLN